MKEWSLRIPKEPFIDEKGAKIYEWENKEKIRFRVIADTIRKSKREGDNCHSTPFTNAIITFYSDRNLNERMEFNVLQGIANET